MKTLPQILRIGWLFMLEPPWRTTRQYDEQYLHWMYWLAGWGWTLAGLVLGALVAPTLMQLVQLADTPYQDWLVIAFAVLAGFLVQVLGWALLSLWAILLPNGLEFEPDPLEGKPFLLVVLLLITFAVAVVAPIVGVGYGIYRYLIWIGPGQRSVAVAFVGGLLIKTFLIPAIWGAFKSKAFKWFMNWLRGGKDTKKAT